MFKTLDMMKKRDERGFTLIELLIVIAIIAILAAIAIPQFAAYRERGVRATMIADAKNTATNQEALFGDCQTYAAVTATSAVPGTVAEGGLSTSCPATNPTVITFTASKGNTITVVAAANTYAITVSNPNGAGTGWDPLLMTGGPGTAAPSCAFANSTKC